MTTDPTPSPDVREIAEDAVRKAIYDIADSDQWLSGGSRRRVAAAVLAAVSPVIRQQERAAVAETLRLVSKGRASYLAAYRSTEGWNESRTILDAEEVSYAVAAEIAEGATEPLYGLLPSWMWSDEMNEQVDRGLAHTHAHPEEGK